MSQRNPNWDPTAFVHSEARVHPSVKLKMGCYIGPKVIIAEGSVVGAYSVIGGNAEHRDFYRDSHESDDFKGVLIGRGVNIFEFVSIHTGTKARTTVMNEAAIFNHSHIGHDCYLSQRVLVGGQTTLAGHVHVMEGANISGRVAVHQKCVIGPYAMLGAGAILRIHLPPGEKWIGSPARHAGYNDIGLERAGFTFENREGYQPGEDEEYDGYAYPGLMEMYLDSYKHLVQRSGL